MKTAPSEAPSKEVLGIVSGIRQEIRAGITNKSLRNGSLLNLNKLAGRRLTQAQRLAVVTALLGYVGASVQHQTDEEGVLNIPSPYRFSWNRLMRRLRLIMPA